MEISDKQELLARLELKERELYSIQKISRALSNTLQLDDLLNLIMKEITELMDADRSTLYLVDPQKGEIWSKIALKSEIREIRQKFGKGISGVVASTGDIINIPDAYQDDRFDPSTDKKTGYRTRSILCMPVWNPISTGKQREIIGVIQVLNKRSGPFTTADEQTLQAICSEVAVAISNARLYAELENKYQELDLLYRLEQLLASEYDIAKLFGKLLQELIEHFKTEFVAVVFPDGQYSRILARRKDGRLYTDRAATLFEKFSENLPDNSGVIENRIKPLATEAFPLLEWPEDCCLSYKKISFQVQEAEQSAWFFWQTIATEKKLQLDAPVIELVSQKIARALELHHLRDAFIRQERLSAVGKMMSAIVHDLRSPVNSIYGFMELLLDESTTPEERQEYAEIIRAELQTITSMVTEILDFAKGKTSILPRKTSIKAVMERFKPKLEQIFRSGNFEVNVDADIKGLIYADVDKLTRAFFNLAKNAKEAMGTKGKFEVSVKEVDDGFQFSFSDTGPGIPAEIRDKIFESFVTSGKESGTGLGLAIVKKIVEDHQGKIELSSEKGKGTTFRIILPKYKN
ncbi:MAG: hypothetical protein Kow0037_15580 [Calditrichia bacterium]